MIIACSSCGSLLVLLDTAPDRGSRQRTRRRGAQQAPPKQGQDTGIHGHQCTTRHTNKPNNSCVKHKVVNEINTERVLDDHNIGDFT